MEGATNREWDNYAKEWMKGLPLMVEKGYYKPTPKKNSEGLKILISLLIGMVISSVLFYGLYNDKFKSEISQNASFTPLINITNDHDIPVNVNNEYDFNPKNNFTIYVNNFIDCPNG